MGYAKASGRLLAAAFAMMGVGSCGQVDDRGDLERASSTFEKASGIGPRWSTESVVEPVQAGPDGQLSLQHAVEFALRNNRSLRADLHAISQARADLAQAGLLSNPVLSFAGMLPEGGGRADLTFGLSKDFADLWLIPSRKRAAQAALQQRVLSFVDSAISLVNEVRGAYYGLQYQVRAISLQEQNVRLLKEVQGIIEARLKAGQAAQVDVYFTQGRLLETQLELLQLQAEERVSRQLLLRLMGVADSYEPWKCTPLNEQSTVVAASETDAISAALRQRLDVQASRWDLDSAIAQVEQQRLRVIPSLNLGLAGERFERRSLPGRKILADTARASVRSGTLTAPEIQSRGQRNIERRQIIDADLGPSIEVPLPIFDQNRAQIAKAQARARELLQRLEEVEQRVIESVRSVVTRLRLAEDRVKLYHGSLIPQWEANLDVSRQAYLAGRESIVTVLLAQETLIRSRLGYALALRDLAMSTANLEREISGRLTDLAPPNTAVTTQPAAPPTGAADKEMKP